MDELVKCQVIYGSIEIVPTYRFDGDSCYFGGYSILRDLYWAEISRTEPQDNFRVYYTSLELKKTLWQKLTSWM